MRTMCPGSAHQPDEDSQERCISRDVLDASVCIVPEYIKDEQTIVSKMDLWKADVMRECFDENGKPIPHPTRNTVLMDSTKILDDIVTSAKRRFKKCVPPDHLRCLAYMDTGESEGEGEVD